MPYKNPQSKEAKESQKRRNKKYYEKNKIEILEKKKPVMRKYYKKNKSKWTATTEQNVMNRRKRLYGVNSDDYYDLLEKQKYKCAICGRHKDEFKFSLCVDHDHKTGKVRGLLCHGCNVGIGRMEDNIESLKNAINYLLNN